MWWLFLFLSGLLRGNQSSSETSPLIQLYLWVYNPKSGNHGNFFRKWWLKGTHHWLTFSHLSLEWGGRSSCQFAETPDDSSLVEVSWPLTEGPLVLHEQILSRVTELPAPLFILSLPNFFINYCLSHYPSCCYDSFPSDVNGWGRLWLPLYLFASSIYKQLAPYASDC